jgi:hypothetical protein
MTDRVSEQAAENARKWQLYACVRTAHVLGEINRAAWVHPAAEEFLELLRGWFRASLANAQSKEEALQAQATLRGKLTALLQWAKDTRRLWPSVEEE